MIGIITDHLATVILENVATHKSHACIGNLLTSSEHVLQLLTLQLLKGRLHGAFSMCVSRSDKPFDTVTFDFGGQASATNGLSDMKTPSKTHRVIDPLLIYHLLSSLTEWQSCGIQLLSISIDGHSQKDHQERDEKSPT
jgi:hypothetical protein